MNIFFPDIHITLTKNFAKAVEKLGHNLVLPSKDYKISHLPPQNWVWNDNHDNSSIDKHGLPSSTKFVNNEELFDLKPEIIFVTAFENQFEVINHIWEEAKNWGAKLVFYSGNDYWDTAYPWDIIENYMPADQLASILCRKHQKNYIHYRPWIDYEMFSFDKTSDSNSIGTYICEYEKNFPDDFKIYQHITHNTPFDYILCEKNTKQETADIMNESFCSLHIKRLEGYGFAIIESMARGRPVFFWEPLTVNKSYLQWLELGVTGFTFRDINDYISQINFLHQEDDFRRECQSACAQKIRSLINNEEQNEILNNFLNNLK